MQLREPSELVTPRAKFYWAAQGAIIVIVLSAAVVAGVITHVLGGWMLASAMAAVALIAVISCLVVPIWRYRVHRWEITSDAVYTQTGWLDQERRIAPLSRVQTVDLERGPIEQLFKLGSVTITTASAKGALKIHGLDREIAERVVHDLTVTTAATEGDAT